MIRFGIVGTSRITDEFLRGAFETGDFALGAVYSRTEDQAKAFAAKYSVSQIYTDLEAMAKSAEIDAVYIASPNSCHAQQALVFLENGKHVLCEKPVASNSKELTFMIEAARRQRVVLMEAMKTGFMPNFQAVRENLHKIGKIRRFMSMKCQYSSRYDQYKQGKNPNTFNLAFSNGSLMDIGVYCVYGAVYLFGRPNRIQASALMLESGVDGSGCIHFKYEGMDAVILHSKITDSVLDSEIQGEEGSICIDNISSPQRVTIRYRDGSAEDITREQINHTMYYEAREFIDLIRSNRLESGTNSHQTSLTVMEILDSARRQVGLIFPADQG